MDAIRDLYLNSGVVKKFPKDNCIHYFDLYFKVNEELYVKLGPWTLDQIRDDRVIETLPTVKEAYLIVDKLKDIIETSKIFSDTPLFNQWNFIINPLEWHRMWTRKTEGDLLFTVNVIDQHIGLSNKTLGRIIIEVKRTE